jgi:hypothetical protein
MKEADDPTGQNAGAANSTPPDHANGKVEKDMKGLVYAGDTREPPPETESYISPEPTSPDMPKPSAEDTVEPHEKEETILNFTEKEGKGKLIILIIIAAVIIIGVVYLALHAKGAKVTVTIPTTTVVGKPTTTVAGPNYNKTSVLNIDLLYNYTGPNKMNNTSCGKSKVSTVKSLNAKYNGTTTFYLYDSESSGYCPLSINKIVATTPGFKVISVTPSLPSSIPAYSSIYLIVKVQTPTFNYTGPLSMTINEN